MWEEDHGEEGGRSGSTSIGADVVASGQDGRRIEDSASGVVAIGVGAVAGPNGAGNWSVGGSDVHSAYALLQGGATRTGSAAIKAGIAQPRQD